jgi:hypothetical protein
MARDPIVDEVRSFREDEAAKYGFDVKAILVASKRLQRRSRRKVVSFVQKRNCALDPECFPIRVTKRIEVTPTA